VSGLVAAYGRALTGVLLLLVTLWVLGMILLPQATIVERSLWWTERPAEAEAVGLRLDALHNEAMVKELDLADAAGAARAAIEAELEAMRAEIARLEALETAPVKVWGLANYTRMSGLHAYVFVRTIVYAGLVTLLALVVCYPIAWAVAQRAPPARAALLMLGLVVPYAINELLRIYAWLMILDYQGVINGLLARAGIVSFEARTWIPFLEGPGAVFVAMVYAYVLFMAFPLIGAMQTLDRNQIEAARDLGASTPMIHRRVVIPHSRPGIAVGCIMVFMLSVGSYSVPHIMTRGVGGEWFSQLIYRQFFEASNWNIGAAYAFALMLVCLLVVAAVMRLFKVGIREIAR
jgi:spermidine/putrescine transport system permease protein